MIKKIQKNFNKINVLIITNIPSPYMIEYLNNLGKLCTLTAAFELLEAQDRNSLWYTKGNNNFKMINLKAFRLGKESGLAIKVLKLLSQKKYDRIIIANPTTPTGIIALLYCRWFKISFIIQSEGGFQGTGRGLKEKFKKYIMEKADLYLTGMGRENDYFLKYGATKEKLCPYPFTSLNEKDLLDAKKIKKIDRFKLRSKLKIIEKKVVLSVGRFSYNDGYGKGYDYLMHLSKKLTSEVGIYIVGDNPTIEFIEWKNKEKLDNVHFIGFKNKEELKEYYACADLFILLTRGDTWGLVINEAMSYALPVITSNKCIAGIELIENNVNGYVVSLDNQKDILEKIEDILNSNDKMLLFGLESQKKIQRYTIENMTKVIWNSIKK